MRFIYIILLSLLAFYANAEKVKTIELSFDIKDFKIVHNEKGLLEISSTKHLISYGEDVTEPGLPLLGIKVVIPQGTEFQKLSIEGSKQFVQTNALIAPNPSAVPTNAIPKTSLTTIPTYRNKVYPDNIVTHVSTNTMDGYTLVSLLVSPFEYDALKGDLYFYEKMSVKINLINSISTSFNFSLFTGKNAKHWIKHLVINPEDIEEPVISEALSKTLSSSYSVNPVDYLIITSNSLLSSFNELIEWKRIKGIRTEAISVDSICNKYTGNTIQQKIKNCLYDYYANRGLKYVLLGGDDTVLPVQYCYAKVGSTVTSHMPSDLYYGCFSGDFEWDRDGDGIVGEIADGVDFSPSIYISRLPIRTQEHVIAYLNKLISYEKYPLSKPWHNEILMAGVMFQKKLDTGQSDAEVKADNLYENYIRPYWPGNRVKFFDTNTDFPGGNSYHLNVQNLQSQLQHGYAFFEMGTHASEEDWTLEYSNFYRKENASSLHNEGYTFVATVSCFTNAFDSTHVNIPDPCLSEAFIRNPNSGVVAYLGCSREGWTGKGDTTLNSALQYSYSYEAEFYKSLFHNTNRFHNYAEVVAITKMKKINSCVINGADRWIQLGLNPIGDPEMPIYTKTPSVFDSCEISLHDSEINIDTGTDSCTICVMSTADNGASYYEVRNYVDSAIFQNINQEVTVCVTKHNYVPKIIKVGPIINIQNEKIFDSRTYIANEINIGAHVTDSKPIGKVVFEGNKTLIRAKSVKMKPGTHMKIGTQLIIMNN